MNKTNIISNNEDLAEVCKVLLQYDAMAVDTEFVWQRTYYPILGIIQVGVNRDLAFIIDVMSINDITPLKEIFENPTIVKIFHDAHQDIVIINKFIDCTITNVFDTQRSLGFCGKERSLSLEKVVHEYTGIYLQKSETRTDWTHRPLSEKQVDYALDDVRYLPEIREKIVKEVELYDNLPYLMDEMKIYENIIPFDFNEIIGKQYQKFASRINGKYRNRAYKLVLFQEETAIKKNIPREHVVKKNVLVSIAQSDIEDIVELKESRLLTIKQLNKYGKTIIEYLDKDLTVPKNIQKLIKRKPSSSQELTVVINLFHAFLDTVAEKHHIVTSIIFNKNELINYVRKFIKQGKPPIQNNWRDDFLSDYCNSFFEGRVKIDIKKDEE